ncbi:MGA_1079 family surface serine endopeptidase [Mycoplasma simbae]|uniref:MGA_1079 family surface serine endopeptidase n=1 Tax=Mycoplasma simbae TaxID=36744 RepID=UPI0004973D45|nr:hypothetical protein [Mycoplasma simbae]
MSLQNDKKRKKIIFASVGAGVLVTGAAIGLGIGLSRNKSVQESEVVRPKPKKEDDNKQKYIEKVNEIISSGLTSLKLFKDKILANLKGNQTSEYLLNDNYYTQLQILIDNYQSLQNQIKENIALLSDNSFKNAYENLVSNANPFALLSLQLANTINSSEVDINFANLNDSLNAIKQQNQQTKLNVQEFKNKYDSFIESIDFSHIFIDKKVIIASQELKNDFQQNSNFNTYLTKLQTHKELTSELDNINNEYQNEPAISQELNSYSALKSDDSNLNNLATLNAKLHDLKEKITAKLAEKSSQNQEIINLKAESKTQINSLDLLTNESKSLFNQNIDNSVSKANISLLVERAKALNNAKNELNSQLNQYTDLVANTDSNYINASNKQDLDDYVASNMFNDASSAQKLKHIYTMSETDSYLDSLTQFKHSLTTKLNNLDGVQRLQEAKNSFNHILTSKPFIDSLKNKLSTWVLEQTLVSKIEQISNKLTQLDQIFVDFEQAKQTEQSLSSTNLTQEQNRELAQLKNHVVIHFDNNKLKNFNIVQLDTYKDNVLNAIHAWNAKMQEFKQNQNDQEVDQDFQTKAQRLLSITLDPRLDKYDIKRYLSSVSFNKENAKLYLVEPKANGVNYELSSVNLNQNNKNIVEFNYIATSTLNDNQRANVSAQLDLSQINPNVDVNQLITDLNVADLDEIYDINYVALSNISKIDLNIANLNEYISKSKTYTSNYFTFDIKQGQSNLVDADNKLSFEVELFLHNSLIKTLTLKSKQSISFIQDQSFDANITLSQEFIDSDPYFDDSKNTFQYFTETNKTEYDSATKEQGIFRYWFWKYKIAPFYETIKDQFNNKVFKLEPLKTPNPRGLPKQKQIAVFEKKYSEYAQNELNFEEVKQVLLLWFKSQNNTVNWNVADDVTVDFKLQNGNLYSVDQNELNSTANFIFTLTKGQLQKEIKFAIAKKNYYKPVISTEDQRYKDKVEEILADKTGEKLFSILKIKDQSKNNGLYSVIQGDPAEMFNEFYEFPKIGKYQIFAKKTVSKNNLAGSADIFFWYKDDSNQWVAYNTTASTRESVFENENKITIKNWKPAQYRDIKPKSGNEYTDADFEPIASQGQSNSIEQADINAINQLNARNFDYRKAEGEKNGSKSVQYRLIDPADIVAQKASSMLNYVLTIKNTPQVDNANNNNFANTHPSETTNPDGSKANNEPSNANGINIQNQDIFTSSDQANNVDTNALFNKYFIYFYDVQNPEKGKMSFKLGFINKQDTNKRYKTNHRITLVNLVNDYKIKLYPEVILNRIKHSDLNINVQNISASSINSSNFDSYITIKPQALTYNNFTINASDIQLSEVKVHEGNKAYIRLKYSANGANIEGSTWYLIQGFNSSQNSTQAQLNISKTKPLTTIYDSNNSVTRSRELELFYKDALWSFDEQDLSANFTLKAKYLAKTFEANNASRRKIHIHLFGNTLVQNLNRSKRIIGREANEGQDLTLDYDALKTNTTLTLTGHTSKVYFENQGKGQAPTINYELKATLKTNGDIDFKFRVTNEQYKLHLGTISQNVYQGANFYSSEKFDEFNPQKAFLLAKNSAAFHIEYTNSVENEDFGIKTNEFNYHKIDFNEENQPITFYSDQKAYDLEQYNPNQNVHYKLHEGYLMDFEFMHKGWDSNAEQTKLIKNSRERTFGYRFGSATMLAKVNKDPKDGKFYIITNNHVEAGHNFDIDSNSGDALPKQTNGGYMAIAAPDYGNAVDAGFSYWGGLYNVGLKNTNVVWTGVKQKDKQGNGQSFVDITVSIVDINPLIAQAKAKGEFLKAFWLQNWFDLPDLELKTNGAEDLEFWAPTRKHFAFNGFPYGKQSGYIANRASSADKTIGFSRQNGYVQTFFNAGNSGTGVIGPDNQYISTINSGAPLTFLQSWTYSTNSHNYFGINWNKQNPLELNNNNSLASFIMKLHAKNPMSYGLAWFFKPFEE